MVITDVNQVVYQGDGINTAWPFTFRIIDATDVKLMLIDADGTETDITSDYFVDTINNTVHYPGYAPGAEPPESEQPAPVQTGQRLVIYRELPITQEKNLGDKWPFSIIELALDKLTMILQQIYEWWDRCLKISPIARSEHPDFDMTFPVEAGKSFRINADATGFEVSDDPQPYAEMAMEAATTASEAAEAAEAAAAATILQAVWYDNVADMVAGNLPAGNTAGTKGYYSVNDGGAGIYNVRAKTNTDVDDAGSIIFLGNGNVAELIIDGVVNVKQFGAKGDGSTNDAAAINNAINCTKANQILFPKATYALNSEIIFNRGNVTVIGNRATLFCLSSYVSRHVFWLRNDSSQMHNIVIDGLEINGNKANITSNLTGILAGSSSTDPITDITIKNCYIHDTTHNGIHLDGYTVDNNPVQRGSRLLIEKCHVANTRLAICQSGVTSTIRDCTLSNSALENITVDNGCRNCEIVNNTINVHYGGCGNIGTDGSDQTRIIGNRIDNGNNTTAATDLNVGICFNANTGPCNFCVVADNQILGNTKYGIWIKDKTDIGRHIGCGYTTITGNVFTSNAVKDIYIDNVYGSAGSNLVIANNRYTTVDGVELNSTNLNNIVKRSSFDAEVKGLVKLTKEANVNDFEYNGFLVGRYLVLTLTFSFSTIASEGWTKICTPNVTITKGTAFTFVAGYSGEARDGVASAIEGNGIRIWVYTTDVSKKFSANH